MKLEDVDSNIAKKLLTAEQRRARDVMADVDVKYAEKKRILVMGYERAKTEEQVHYKQKDYRKYERLFERYAYPINSLKVDEKDRSNIMASIEDSDQLVSSKI